MSNSSWPDLAYSSWSETAAALHLWTQIVGKIRLATTPWLNHSWQVPLYVTARGLGTSPMPHGDDIFEMEFDFIEHRLAIAVSNGRHGALALTPGSVADFHGAVMSMLKNVGIDIIIHDVPNEIADPVRFPDDHRQRPYDAAAANRFWQVLIRADRLLKAFRTGFLGKASPVHFFWGSFDLATTRFSGRIAPPHPGSVPGLPDEVLREAYSHELSSAGFWPGGDAFPEAVFYSYAYPEPRGFRDSRVTPGARFDPVLGEFLLPYDIVRAAPDPDRLVLDFLSSTYEAAAEAANWDRDALECELGVPRRVRRPASG